MPAWLAHAGAVTTMRGNAGNLGKHTPKLTVRRLADVGDSGSSSQTARATLALREMLVQGRLPPGEKIREVPLSEELKISRIPLHLALERLANEGFLEVLPKRGFRVHSFFLRRESGLDDLPAGLLCCVEASKTYDQATSPLLYLRL